MNDSVYRERAYLVAHLASAYPSTIGYHDPSEPGWAVVIVDLPTGQASWHVAPSDMDLFDGVRRSSVNTWDGHSTDTKYERLRALTRLLNKGSCDECIIQRDAVGNVVINEPCEEHS